MLMAGLGAIADRFGDVTIDLTVDGMQAEFDLGAMRTRGQVVKQVACGLQVINGVIGSIVVTVYIRIGSQTRSAGTMASGTQARIDIDVSQADALIYRVTTPGSSGELGLVSTTPSDCCP